MIYRRFNYRIYEYYFKDNYSGDEIIMSVDSSLIEEFLSKEKITSIDLQNSLKSHFHKNWEYANELNSEIPNFFGLIAIQIYIASLMEDDEVNDYSKNDYNPRLADYLGIAENNIENIYTKWQDKIWQNLKSWARKKDFQIYVDDIGKYKGRFIKYPLSHSLLNINDLKYTPLLFDCCGYTPHEEILFLDFKDKISKFIDNQKITSHFSKIKSRLEKDGNLDRLYKQIYAFYNKWEGEVPIINEKASTKTDVETFKTIERTDFYYDYEKGEVYKLTGNDNRSETIYLTDLELFNKIKKDSNTLFFEKGNYEEWQYSRTLSYQTYIIICENHYRYILNQLGNVLNDFSYKSNNQYTIKEVKVNNFNHRFFSKDIHAYSIENGLKIGRTQWLKNAGPDIVVNANNQIRINGVPHKGQRISLRNFEAGVYKIRDGTKRTDIEIVELPIISTNPKETGWRIEKKANKWQFPENEYNINGLNYKFSKFEINENTKTWISIFAKRAKNKKYKSQVINALNRINYGI
ncbi:MAG: hypothetical protein H6Q14_393 [Bacteroidetes bacterium]|nr:hypothetical protein [Bacteroidota bacterium]